MIPPWIISFVFFSFGIILAYFSAWTEAVTAAIIIILASVFFTVYRQDFIVLLIVFLGGILLFQVQHYPSADGLSERDHIDIIGTVHNFPVYDGETYSFCIKTESNNPYHNMFKVYCDFDPDINKGDQVKARGEIRLPGKPGNPGEFDYSAYLAKQGIYYILYPYNAKDLQLTKSSGTLEGYFNYYRSQAEELIRSVLPPDEAGIMLGMLMGNKTGIEQEQYQEFQQAGIVHIFAVSGLHVGFLTLFCTFLFQLFDLSKRTRFMLTVLILILYATLVGWPVSVKRAVIMASLALLAHYQGRKGGLMNSLGLAGIVILLIDPYALFTISFQLSFAAAAGIVGIFPLIKESFSYNSRILDVLLIPLCAQVPVLPLVAYYFNLISPLGVISNILISYIAAGTVMLGFMALILAVYLPILASFFLYPAGFFIELLSRLSSLVNAIPFSYLWVKTPELWLICLYYLSLFYLVLGLKKLEGKNGESSVNSTVSVPGLTVIHRPVRFRCLSVMVLMLTLAVFCIPGNYYGRGEIKLVFIDVGQGDGILLKTPGGKFILVDGGGSHYYEVGKRKVLPFLRHCGIRQLDLVINTHPDTDHLQGILELMQEMPVQYAAVPSVLLDVPEYEPLKELALGQQASLIALKQGMKLEVEPGFVLQVLYPPELYQAPDYNSASVVLSLNYRDFSILLTGDCEESSLRQLAGRVPEALVVKVPHHGSRGALLPLVYEETDPKIAVISCGKNNPFGHPHHEVIDYLLHKNIKIYRTDQQGAITFTTDGSSLRISTFK